MKSLITAILAIASIILGLYMLIVNILNYSQSSDYHIGCYLSNPTFNQSINLRQKVKQLELSSRFRKNLDSKLRNSALIDENLHQKAVNLTKNVQQYIKKLTLVKRYQQSNMQFFTQLAVASKNYENCSNELKSNFNSQQCKSLWAEYNNCFEKYSKQKRDLQSLYRSRQNYLKQIDELMIFNPNENSQFDMEAELKIIRAKYDRLNAQNDKEKEEYISQLKKLNYKNQSKSNEYDQTQRQVAKTKEQYQICLKNQREFSKCQEIKKTIKEYGYSESTESLEEKIKQKRQVLMRMMELIKQNSDNMDIKQMYKKREQELKHLMKLQIDMKFSENRQCGCSESQREELQNTYESYKIRLSQTLKQIRDLTQSIDQLKSKIRQNQNQRLNLLNQYKKQTEHLDTQNRNNGKSLKQRLQILKVNVNKVNGNINLYNPILNSLEFQCNQYKKRLSDKVHESNKISECLSKKNFYKQLSSKAEQILKQDDSDSLIIENRIIDIFSTIEYPRSISIDQIRRQSQINMIEGQDVPLINNKQDESKHQTQHLSPQQIVKQVIEQYASPSEVQNNQQANHPSQDQQEAPSQTNTISQKNGETSQLNPQDQKITIKVEEQVHVEQNPNEQIVEVHEKVTIDVGQL